MAESPRLKTIDAQRLIDPKMRPIAKNRLSCSVDYEVSLINTKPQDGKTRLTLAPHLAKEKANNSLLSKSIDVDAIHRGGKKQTSYATRRSHNFKNYCKKLGNTIFAGDRKELD